MWKPFGICKIKGAFVPSRHCGIFAREHNVSLRKNPDLTAFSLSSSNANETDFKLIPRLREAEEALKPITPTNVLVIALRFPTSLESIGSDAVNKDPYDSAAYGILATDTDIQCHALIFKLSHGTELCLCDRRSSEVCPKSPAGIDYLRSQWLLP